MQQKSLRWKNTTYKTTYNSPKTTYQSFTSKTSYKSTYNSSMATDKSSYNSSMVTYKSYIHKYIHIIFVKAGPFVAT